MIDNHSALTELKDHGPLDILHFPLLFISDSLPGLWCTDYMTSRPAQEVFYASGFIKKIESKWTEEKSKLIQYSVWPPSAHKQHQDFKTDWGFKRLFWRSCLPKSNTIMSFCRQHYSIVGVSSKSRAANGFGEYRQILIPHAKPSGRHLIDPKFVLGQRPQTSNQCL